MPPQELSDVQSALIADIARKQGLQNFHVTAESGTEKGDNYLGIITNVSVKDEEKKLNLILKTSHSDEKFRQNMPISTLYEREIYVYEKLFPLLDNLQREFNVKHSFKGHATSYGSHNDGTTECLVMEDIRDRGFKLWNRKVPMNAGHLTAVVKEYAKLHSLGMILQAKKPEVFKITTENMFEVFGSKEDDKDEKLSMWVGLMRDKMLKVLDSEPKVIEMMKSRTANLPNYYKSEIKKPELQMTFTHGDCWCNNMMFEYKDPSDETEPEEICFLDWQLSKVGSPAQDLVYYLYTSADIQDLRNFKHYLKVYHDTLSENLTSAGLDPDEIYPYSMLEEQIKHFSLFGLMTAVMIMQLTILDKDEAPDLTTLNNDFSSMINMEGNNQQQYRDRILNLVLFLLDNELL